MTDRRPVAPPADPTQLPAVWWRLACLDPWQENPRIYTREVIRSLADKIIRYGFNTLIGAHWPTRRIVRGHRRRLAMLLIWTEDPAYAIPGSPGPGYVPVRFSGGAWDGIDGSEGDALADNREQENGVWDHQVLGTLIARWETEGAEIAEIAAATAFGDDEIREIVASMRPERPRPKDVPPPEVPEPPRKAHSRLGEVYELGPHRLACGDCTDPNVLSRLLGTELARCVFTDPPFAIYGSSTGLDASIADDKVVRPFFQAILISVIRAAQPFAAVYVCCDWRSWSAWWDGAKATGLSPSNMLIWDKGNAGLGSNYGNSHELVGYYLNKPRRTKMFKGSTGVRVVLRSNMIRTDAPLEPGPDRVDLVDREAFDAAEAEGQDTGADPRAFLKFGRVTGAARVHNAAKPIALIEELLTDSTKPDELVVDLFGGGGSTLLACARLERRARLTEIDPNWCDVIRHRWTAWAKAAGVDPGPGALELDGDRLGIGSVVKDRKTTAKRPKGAEEIDHG